MFEKERRLRSRKIPGSAPGEWEEAALRECVLAGYPESHIKILREIFPALFTIYSEEGAHHEPVYCRSYIKAQLRAAMQDLRYTARFLAMVARQGIYEASEIDQQLGWFADGLALRVEKIADLMEERIVPARARGADEGVA